MGLLEKLLGGGKDTFLGGLQEQIRQQAVSELVSGKLVSPASLDAVCTKVIPAFRKNFVTGAVLKKLEVTDEELRKVIRDALVEAEVVLK